MSEALCNAAMQWVNGREPLPAGSTVYCALAAAETTTATSTTTAKPCSPIIYAPPSPCNGCMEPLMSATTTNCSANYTFFADGQGDVGEYNLTCDRGKWDNNHGAWFSKGQKMYCAPGKPKCHLLLYDDTQSCDQCVQPVFSSISVMCPLNFYPKMYDLMFEGKVIGDSNCADGGTSWTSKSGDTLMEGSKVYCFPQPEPTTETVPTAALLPDATTIPTASA
ncbi:hypothetical protein PENTCL1PPCAC_5157 [Pristionchus entomophagus]|uniref:Sushi domain-containing protein n=1 Tax=Pristionchus entomophagus TaxID=358040 RepID=A0AAV5SK41_9BILA|nr:hypothetical protein PENTCL1PPCAC_5157 [Pristionchus entomophagus]